MHGETSDLEARVSPPIYKLMAKNFTSHALHPYIRLAGLLKFGQKLEAQMNLWDKEVYDGLRGIGSFAGTLELVSGYGGMFTAVLVPASVCFVAALLYGW